MIWWGMVMSGIARQLRQVLALFVASSLGSQGVASSDRERNVEAVEALYVLLRYGTLRQSRRCKFR